ncbi:hypothetical protein SGPA1_20802 [Streptomyces misionensis JCM 4497]
MRVRCAAASRPCPDDGRRQLGLQRRQPLPHRSRRAQRGERPPHLYVVLAPPRVRPVRQQVGVAVRDQSRPQLPLQTLPQPYDRRRLRTGQQRSGVHLHRRGERPRPQPPLHHGRVRVDRRGQPVRSRGQQLRPQQPSQASQFRPQSHRRHRLVRVQRAEQLVTRQPLGVPRQQQHDLAVPTAQPDPPPVEGEFGLVPAQRAQRRRVRGGPHRGEKRQLGLRGPCHRLYEAQAVRMRQPVPAGDVHRAQDPPGARIVHRSGNTRPGLHPPCEVLRREHLHRPAQGDGRSRRVGPHRGLRPACPGHEVHPVRPPPGRRMPLDPQQPALRVAHREQLLVVRGERAHQLPEQRHHLGQRMLRPVGTQITVGQLHTRGTVRYHAGPRAAPPRLRDHRPHRARHRSDRGERLVRPAQHPDALGGIGAWLQGNPRIGQLGLPGR